MKLITALTRKQPPMRRVLLATLPCIAAAVYFFGWRTLAIVGASCATAFAAELLFCRWRKEKVSEAVLVTAVLFALIMPPTAPWHVVIVGNLVAIIFAKEVFGGFGRNIFNPAMVGRCFVYVCFATALTSEWAEPAAGPWGALREWSTYDRGLPKDSPEAMTSATPVAGYKTRLVERNRLENELARTKARTPDDAKRADRLDRQIEQARKDAEQARPELNGLLFGRISGTGGVTSALVILIGGVYLFITKTANRTTILSVVLSYAALSELLNLLGVEPVPNGLRALLGGGFLFGAFYMATDPVSSPRTHYGRIIYGILIAVGTLVIRNFSVFNGGMMFAILLGNMFAPIIDHAVTERIKSRKAKAQPAETPPGSAAGAEGGAP